MSAVEEWKEAHPRMGWKLVRDEAEPLLARIAELEAMGTSESARLSLLLTAERDKQAWMLDTFMHHRHRYMGIRAGYADIFDLVKQDLADDYETHKGGEDR